MSFYVLFVFLFPMFTHGGVLMSFYVLFVFLFPMLTLGGVLMSFYVLFVFLFPMLTLGGALVVFWTFCLCFFPNVRTWRCVCVAKCNKGGGIYCQLHCVYCLFHCLFQNLAHFNYFQHLSSFATLCYVTHCISLNQKLEPLLAFFHPLSYYFIVQALNYKGWGISLNNCNYLCCIPSKLPSLNFKPLNLKPQTCVL